MGKGRREKRIGDQNPGILEELFERRLNFSTEREEFRLG